MRISKGQLRKIIAEEVSRVISEMDVLNADTGELLAIDDLPFKYKDRITSVDGFYALYDKDFNALRADVERNMPVFRPRSSEYDEDLDDMSPDAADAAFERLKVLARKDAANYLDDRGRGHRRGGDAFVDLADGLALTSPDDWETAKQLFDGSEEDLKWALAETMAG